LFETRFAGARSFVRSVFLLSGAFLTAAPTDLFANPTIAALEQKRKELQTKQEDLQSEIEQILAEEQKLAPDSKTRHSQIADRTMAIKRAQKAHQSTLNFIKEQHDAARRADLGDNPPETQIAQWEQTKGKAFAERRLRAARVARQRIKEIDDESQRSLTPKQRELQSRRSGLEGKLYETAKEIDKVEDELRIQQGGVFVRAFSKTLWVDPNATVRLKFYVGGGTGSYLCNGSLGFRSLKDLQTRFNKSKEFNKDLTRSGLCEWSFNAPSETGVFEGSFRVVDDSYDEKDSCSFLVFVGTRSDFPFRVNFYGASSYNTSDASSTYKSKTLWEVPYVVLGGHGPYQITTTLADPNLRSGVRNQPEAGLNMLYVASMQPLKSEGSQLEVRITDANGNEVVEVLRFFTAPRGDNGTGNQPPQNQQGTAPPATTPPTTTKPAKAPKPPPPPLAPGTYRVHLRVPGYIDNPGAGWAKDKAAGEAPDEPIPFDITIDAAGNISGTCVYVFPDEKYDEHLWGNEKIYWDTSFTITGKTDWKTGETELSILDGRVFSYTDDPPHHHGYRIQYKADLKGWRMPGPYEPLLETYHKDLTARFGRARFLAVWPIVRKPDGTYQMQGDGWFGVGTGGSQGLPTRPSTVTLVRRTSYRVYNEERTDEDETERFRQSIWSDKYRGKARWMLEIVGKVSDDVSGLKGELVGRLGVWPVKPSAWPPSPIRVRVGDTIEYEACGVVMPNAFEVTDLTQKASWRHSRRLEKTGRGRYKAREAGTAYVKAGVKTGGEWSITTVKIIIEPKKTDAD